MLFRPFEPLTGTRAAIAFFAALAMLGLGGIVLLLMDPLPHIPRTIGLSTFAAVLVGSIIWFARWWWGSDLEEDDEDDDQESDLKDDQAPVPT
jgi:hypothetical protein